MTKLERFAQLDGLLAEQDGMLQTSQAVARGIVKPIFYEYIKERKFRTGCPWYLCLRGYMD